jgi:hypothetical protein
MCENALIFAHLMTEFFFSENIRIGYQETQYFMLILNLLSDFLKKAPNKHYEFSGFLFLYFSQDFLLLTFSEILFEPFSINLKSAYKFVFSDTQIDLSQGHF